MPTLIIGNWPVVKAVADKNVVAYLLLDTEQSVSASSASAGSSRTQGGGTVSAWSVPNVT